MTSTLEPLTLRSLDLRLLAIQRIRAGRWWKYKHVISPYSRLWLVLEGGATVRHHGRTFKLAPGVVHLVPPFALHDCACAQRLDHFYLHFTARLPTGIDLFSLLDCEWQLPATAETLKHFKRLEELYPGHQLPCFDPAQEEYRQFPVAAEQTTLNLPAPDWFEANSILALLLSPFLRSGHMHEGLHVRTTQQFLSVQQFIHTHMRERILLGDLARAAELHPTYFSDRFRTLVGVRPLDYLMLRRIERAQYLLLTTHEPVKHIAAQVGIPDAAYFSRAFARICGASPSHYRATHGF